MRLSETKLLLMASCIILTCLIVSISLISVFLKRLDKWQNIISAAVNADAHKAGLREIPHHCRSTYSRRVSHFDAHDELAIDRLHTTESRVAREERRVFGRLRVKREDQTAARFERAMEARKEVWKVVFFEVHHEAEACDEVELTVEVERQGVHREWVELVPDETVAVLLADQVEVAVVDVDRVELHALELLCSQQYFAHQTARDTGHRQSGLQEWPNDVAQ